MTEKEIEKKFKTLYPDFVRGDVPLSPYFDIFSFAIEIAETEMENKLQKDKEELKRYKRIFDKLTCRDCIHFNFKSVGCCNEDRHTDAKCELFEIEI